MVVVLELKVVEVADIRFASEGLTRLQTTKWVKLLNGGPRDNLWLKIVPVTISAEYSDYNNILASTIILLIWPSKSHSGAPRLFTRNDNSF